MTGVQTCALPIYKLRCAVSVTLEMDTMALGIFETTIINNIATAMTKALEQAIVSGDGSSKPKGFLKETPNAGQAIEIAEGTALDYDCLLYTSSSGFGNERVQESRKNASERKFIAYADYAKLINDKIDEFYDCKMEILAAINKLDNPTYHALLTGYYINCKTWEQVAEDMNYEIRNIYRIRDKSLKILSNLL